MVSPMVKEPGAMGSIRRPTLFVNAGVSAAQTAAHDNNQSVAMRRGGGNWTMGFKRRTADERNLRLRW